MDSISTELHSFLISFGQNPKLVSHQVGHYVEHLLHLLPTLNEQRLISFYGLFGKTRLTLRQLAQAKNETDTQTAENIAIDLRRLAVTPEWQMLKGLINKK
jgi:hypothetical protein